MDRTERFYLIDRLLHERKLVTRTQFLEELGVSLATFKRDIEYMRSRFHAPIEWNAEREGYEFAAKKGAGPAYELPGLWFNQSEVLALLTMHQLLSALEPGLLAAHVAPLRARLESLLDAGNIHSAEVLRRVRILPLAARKVSAPLFQTIANAVLRRARLKLSYRARSTGAASDREVSPQRLAHYRDNWYLDAWCHTRNDLRIFSLDAIAAATVLAEPSKSIDERTLDRRLGSGYGIFAGDEIEWARLRFSATRTRWVAQEEWHPRQRGLIEADGRYILEVPFSDPRELMMDILKFGADVEVLSPPSLRKFVADEVRKMAAQLGGDTRAPP